MKKLIKVVLVLISIAVIFNWFTSDSSEIRELIKQGYLIADYTKEDLQKLYNSTTDKEKEIGDAYPMWSCINNGVW